jgi:hypothetical protein
MSLPTSEPAAPELRSCPHLGVREDPSTCLGYPAEWNLCYRARPVAAVSLEQQRRLCLSPVYVRCLVFQSAHRAPLPKHLRGVRTRNAWKWALLAALLVLIALGLWAAMQQL